MTLAPTAAAHSRQSGRRLPIALLLGASLLLAACDNSGSWSTTFTASFRTKYIETCAAEASKSAEQKGLKKDWTGACTCMADHMVAISSNPLELIANSSDDKEIATALKKCV